MDKTWRLAEVSSRNEILLSGSTKSFFSERYYHAAILNGHEIMVVGGYDKL